eukprot:scaffold3290_cov165-Ochromonas_danica.AAC.45
MRGDVSPIGRHPTAPKPKRPTPGDKNKAALNLHDLENSIPKPRSPLRSHQGYIRGPTADSEENSPQDSLNTIHLSGDIELGPTIEEEKRSPLAKHSSKKTLSRPGEKLNRATSSTVRTASVEKSGKGSSSRFKGKFPIQYGLYAHYLSYGAGLLCLAVGVFSMVWTDAETYGCKIDDKWVSSIYLLNDQGTCNATYVRNDKVQYICCDPNSKTTLKGYLGIGVVYTLYSIFALLFENTDWGYGLYFPNDTFFYKNRISVIGFTHSVIAIAGLYNYVTCLGGACLLTAGVVYQIAALRFEAGDGGREARRVASQKVQEKRAKRSWGKFCSETCSWLLSFNPATFCRRIFNEDKFSSYFWVGLFAIGNIILFAWALDLWYDKVEAWEHDLLNGTMNVSCKTRLCHYNRKAVRYGPISRFAPWAKGFGTCLNLQCTLLLLPVVKHLIRKISDWGVSFHSAQQKNDWFGRLLAHPLTRYVPLQKNIEFHKLCAWTVFVFSWGHLFFHLMNLFYANNSTMAYFRVWRWEGTYLFSGALVTWAMLVLYAAAFDDVRQSKFEIFFQTHRWMFVLFFLAMFQHGPNFFYWSIGPVLLYIYEKYLQATRGRQPWVVLKVEFIAPVMAVYCRPVFKERFSFKEGQYLYINCPSVSESEWHPMTISSAADDLNNPVRIHLETGEEVVEIPRPKNLPSNAKWNKYCLASQDWQTMDPNDYLDKSDTGFFDYLTVHIKVLGLNEPVPRTWTRKVKEFFDSMGGGGKAIHYFYRRDARGEIQMGRQYGPDNKLPIIRIDGPHSAPTEHYIHYGTVMLVGAGIGLTPTVAILTALTKYRWKKNFNPELLHCYCILRQSEVESFQWFIQALADISFELKKSRAANQIERRYYCEINIYITAVEDQLEVRPLSRSPKKRFISAGGVQPTFTAEDLYAKMLNPSVDSRGQIRKMKEAVMDNRLQDVWVWKGRPQWDEIFSEMKEQRQHSDIGVCFCGPHGIGCDLREMCEKYSDIGEQCLFSLHKENF